MTCDICKTNAISWRHASGAFCDCCKSLIDKRQGGYARHTLPADLVHAPNGSYELAPFPDGAGSRLTWVERS